MAEGRSVTSAAPAATADSAVFTAIVHEAISPDELMARVESPVDGAVLLFLGVVRNHNEGRAVAGLRYDAYEPMAARVLDDIARRAARRFGVSGIAAVHRVGELSVGDVAVAVVTAGPHRADAYDASRWVMEEIKKKLPVWKKERYADGGSGWVTGHPVAPPDLPDGTADA